MRRSKRLKWDNFFPIGAIEKIKIEGVVGKDVISSECFFFSQKKSLKPTDIGVSLILIPKWLYIYKKWNLEKK